LLHDLPHVPFGHTLEDEFGLLVRHDENFPRLDALLKNSRIGALLAEHLDAEEYEQLLFVLDAVAPADEAEKRLSKEERLVERLGEYAYVADIVANTVCADVLDYIVRDLSACGMPVSLGTRFLDTSKSRRLTCRSRRTATGWRCGSTSAGCHAQMSSPRCSSSSATGTSLPNASSSITRKTPRR
jgi:hypothetical protein